ncbi:G-protein coupled receptor 54-like [Branchiostoma lanceolatum]|uniref:G-protein coupled receptor 54-like n=1 Tax=Branchiostoma lanceolatum TaxID=7740 RepID=UPI0034550B35
MDILWETRPRDSARSSTARAHELYRPGRPHYPTGSHDPVPERPPLGPSLPWDGMEETGEAGLMAGLQEDRIHGCNATTGNATFTEDLPGEMGPLGAEAWVVPVLFVLIGVVGVGANALVIYVSNKFNELKTATNRYIVSLAVTDLCFLLVCAPFTASLFATTSWALGKSMCKLVFYFMQVTVKAMCLTRCALTVDRYFAVVHPIASIDYRSPRFAITVSALIWICE